MLYVAVVTVVIVAVLSGPVTDPSLDEEWNEFKITYNKQYNPQNALSRRLIWEENLRYIRKHNMAAKKGEFSFTLGVNKFTDMTHEEFIRVKNGLIPRNSPSSGRLYTPTKDVRDLPGNVDWRTKGYVTPIQDQGECGSCWAFSATGSLEAQTFKKTGKLVKLSEQNLVDCSYKEGNRGCEGGLMDQAFTYIKKNKGINTEKFYPYRAKVDILCHFLPIDVGATDTGFMDIKKDSESDLLEAVATVGPISVAINGAWPSFQHYKDGVYNQTGCGNESDNINHAVLVVGYGSQNGNDYWLVKNSWGTTWGMEGYVKMARNRGNMCGIATQASYPTV